MKNIIYCMLLFFGLFSCAQQHFSKRDYSFYDKDFTLSKTSNLRTDGVYVLTAIWTDENGGTEKKPEQHKFYNFYNSGQSNMILDPENKIKTTQDYLEAVRKSITDSKNKRSTLFESYYKTNADKIVIQGIVYPVKQFEYKYGYITPNGLVIVKATQEGKGSFDDKYFTDYYKEYYTFIAIKDFSSAGVPNW